MYYYLFVDEAVILIVEAALIHSNINLVVLIQYFEAHKKVSQIFSSFLNCVCMFHILLYFCIQISTAYQNS